MFLLFYYGILVVLGNCPVNTNISFALYDLLTNFIHVNKFKYVCFVHHFKQSECTFGFQSNTTTNLYLFILVPHTS